MVVWAKVVVLRAKRFVNRVEWLYSGKSAFVSYSGKVVVFWTKGVVFGQKWFYLCKVIAVFGQKISSIWLYWKKVLLFGQK